MDLRLKAPPKVSKAARLTWLPAFAPAFLFLVFLSLAAHVRIGLGHWPTPMLENYRSAAFDTHGRIFELVAIVTTCVAGPLWLLLLCFRPLRISRRTHLLQAGTYFAGWAVFFLYGVLDPSKFMGWYLD